ncbi:MAG TPA: hypothetical protein VFV13_03395 [Acidimicrobiia bacterium]|nr:hypothetical protein [Acidimicrobiia bacterium]
MRTLWKNLPTGGKAALLAGLAITAASLIATARRDLAARDPSSIRGNPEMWDTATRLPGGATVYLVAGRRSERKSA